VDPGSKFVEKKATNNTPKQSAKKRSAETPEYTTNRMPPPSQHAVRFFAFLERLGLTFSYTPAKKGKDNTAVAERTTG
jgi:hypothetical protein